MQSLTWRRFVVAVNIYIEGLVYRLEHYEKLMVKQDSSYLRDAVAYISRLFLFNDGNQYRLKC